MPEPQVYADRPAVEVLVDGTWWPGDLRMKHTDGRLNVQWTRDGQTYLDNFSPDQVREDTVDRSRGRG